MTPCCHGPSIVPPSHDNHPLNSRITRFGVLMQNGSKGPVQILPITRPPWNACADRRGFLGAGIATSVAAPSC